MHRETRLREAAEGLFPDEEILAVGEFMPKSVADGFFVGAALGAVVGRGLGSLPGGAGAGAITGAVMGEGSSDLPRYVGLAVTPVHVHLLGIPNTFFRKEPEDAYHLATFDRDDLHVEVKGRVGDHLVTLTNTSSDETLTLAADRISGHYSKTVMHLLRLGPEHYDDVDDEEAAETETS